MAPPKSKNGLKPQKSGGLLSGLLGKETVVDPQVTKPPAAAVSSPSPLTAPVSATSPVSPPASMSSSSCPVKPAMPQLNGSAAAAPGGAAAPSTPAPAAPKPAAAAAAPSPPGAAAMMGAPAQTAAKAGPKIGIDDARAAWQPKPRIPVRLMDNYINFMVIGDSGLAKTTFVNNLTSSYRVKSPASDTATMAAFQANPEALRTFLEPMDIPEAGRRLHVTLQDMPGWGDDINLVRYLKVVLSYILEQRAKDYELLEGSRAMNEVAMCGQLQNSITACVYFLAPHRVKKVDLILISALSQLVTVIPVIAKADSMTEQELAEYRTEIRAMLSHPAKFAPSRSLPPLTFNNFSWDTDVMSTLGIEPERLPLALITSKDSDVVHSTALLNDLGLDPSSGGVAQPVRKYKWGTAYALNRDHSDLLLLKRLMMGDRVDSLYAMLDESYSRYIDFCAKYEESGKQLPTLVQAASSLTTPYLEYDDYTKAQAALDAAQQAMSTLMSENKALLERLNALERAAGRGVMPSSIVSQGSGRIPEALKGHIATLH